MSSTTTTWKYLEPNPKSAYRQLFIKGRRIRARTLFGLYMSAEEPLTVEEIAREYDLPVEAVKEAIDVETPLGAGLLGSQTRFN